MNSIHFIFRSLTHFKRLHAGTVVGTAVSVAVLIGALLVGSSLHATMANQTAKRLGSAAFVVDASARPVTPHLGDTLAQELSTSVASVLRCRAIVTAPQNSSIIGDVSLYGIDSSFYSLSDYTIPPPAAGEVFLNQELAQSLNAVIGSVVVIKTPKRSLFPSEVMGASTEAATVLLRCRVARICTNDELGSFDLRTDHRSPRNAFVDRTWLAQKTDLPNRADLLLIADTPRTLTTDTLHHLLAKFATLDDAGLSLRTVRGSIEMRSFRVFIEPSLLDIAKSIQPMGNGVFSYFVNALRTGKDTVPYSFVCAVADTLNLPDSAIVLTAWSAKELDASVGDKLTIDYFTVGPLNRLVEKSSVFTVSKIIEMDDQLVDSTLMPAFPGFAQVDDCRDWDPSIPIDLNRIRPRDEAYWKKYRGTPKAFIAFNVAQRLWQNRYGSATAIRFDSAKTSIDSMPVSLREMPGLVAQTWKIIDLRGIAAAARLAVDFGSLFLGFSMLIVAAALLLTTQLFLFSIVSRSSETGVLYALGFKAKQVFRLRMAEGAGLVLVGACCGAIFGLLYHRLLLWGLTTIWRDATRITGFSAPIDMNAILIGALGGMLLSLAVIAVAARHQNHGSITGLLGHGIPAFARMEKKSRGWSGIAALVCCLISIGLIIGVDARVNANATALFFCAGTFMLVGLAISARFILNPTHGRTGQLDFWKLIHRSLCKNSRENSTLILMLSIGTFIVVAIGANRLTPPTNPLDPRCGTGGFLLYCETTTPLMLDLSTPGGKRNFGLPDSLACRFVQFRLRDADDASCLNLNQPLSPKIYGVDPNELASINAFSLTIDKISADQPDSWHVLNKVLPDSSIPAIADKNTLSWSLKKNVGDTLLVLDETGKVRTIKIIGSIAPSVLAGGLIVASEPFIKLFPSISGSRLVLASAPLGSSVDLQNLLNRHLADFGGQCITTIERLNKLNAVENTYLSIFLMLGGLGLLLGTAGIGSMIVRSVMLRRGELAILRAIGFKRRLVVRLLFGEYALLFVAGLGSGTVTALVSVYPSMVASSKSFPFLTITILIGAILLFGFLSIAFAIKTALQGSLVEALRNE